jgi:hypothetical protein
MTDLGDEGSIYFLYFILYYIGITSVPFETRKLYYIGPCITSTLSVTRTRVRSSVQKLQNYKITDFHQRDNSHQILVKLDGVLSNYYMVSNLRHHLIYKL